MKEVNSFLINNIKKDSTVITAISGGPDSMALLNVLNNLKNKLNIKIVCAHVNHNTGRIGQKEEEKYVQSFCKKNNIIFELMTIKNYSDDNFENEARTKRYNFFEELISKYNSKYLLTAHHSDDLIETILMRISRGSTLKGYSGFEKIVVRKNYQIIRPFIEITKEEIIKYNKENKIKYFIDKTNLEDIHTRNRFRKYIVPKLKEENNNIHKKFYKFSTTLLEYDEYVEKQAKKYYNEVYVNDNINIKKLKELEYIIQKKIIYNVLENLYSDDLMLITDVHVNLIFDLINSKKANLYICLPNNFNVVKKYDYISFEEAIEKEDEYEVEIINNVILPNNKKIEVLENSNQTDNYICRLSKKDVLFPLHVRSRKSGDKMIIKGMTGSKKINDIFINEKIPLEQRNIWPIVVDSAGKVVWLPGLKKSKFDKQKDEKYDIILKYY